MPFGQPPPGDHSFPRPPTSPYWIKLKNPRGLSVRLQEANFNGRGTIVDSIHVWAESDVFAVRRHMLNFVPAELVLMIVELAGYWPKVTSTREALSGATSVPGASRDREWCYAISPPLPYFPGTITRPRRVEFTVECAAGRTHDQICSDYTLFHAAVIKPTDLSQNSLFEPLEAKPERYVKSSAISGQGRWLVQDVPLAWPAGSQQKVVWEQPEEAQTASEPQSSLLDNLACGDRVAVMVRGMIPGWMNCIYTIKTDIYYSI